jgi:hypothetical protein
MEAPTQLPGRATLVVRDRFAHRPAGRDASTQFAVPMRTLLGTRQLIEERARREVASMVAPRPIFRGPPLEEAGLSRRAAPVSRDESARGASETARATRAPAQPSVPQIDVERLTDQVVRRIDERIVAYRERMGKAL